MGISTIVISFTLLLASTQAFSYSEQQIHQAKQEIILLSVQSYSGSCPCPYSQTLNGSMCGRKSLYVKPDGRAPACFVQDISNAEAIHYLKRK